MTRRKYGHYFLIFLLSGLGLLLLARVFFRGGSVLVPEDVDVLLLVSFLGLAMVAAIHTIVRISMRHQWLLSARRARQEVLLEHGRFLQRLDHELKNPLTTLRTGLSALSLTDLDARQRQMVRTMERETVRLSQLVADLRKLAELEAQPLDLQPMDMEAFVASIIQMERDRFEAGAREFAVQVEAEETVWVVDEDLLAVAVHNLLDNAFKYTQPADSIRLEVSAGDELTIRVRDTGAGIPHSDLPHVWEELYRAEQAQKVSGSGIGLALVKAIVERHDGTVDMESEPGEGTTVTIHLPPVGP